ncbi:hypothetical protein Nepgr_015317 [Nepenthes gracilis]|uniref:Uncharacterized protein n=1 Tax=Nepenthes gracilis TaxID=150966 RepID=A0AAD3SNA8_NEPGR|nr:hypothetical protein Nepgr_015317 [Nepenthes gracilis]
MPANQDHSTGLCCKIGLMAARKDCFFYKRMERPYQTPMENFSSWPFLSPAASNILHPCLHTVYIVNSSSSESGACCSANSFHPRAGNIKQQREKKKRVLLLVICNNKLLICVDYKTIALGKKMLEHSKDLPLVSVVLGGVFSAQIFRG